MTRWETVIQIAKLVLGLYALYLLQTIANAVR